MTDDRKALSEARRLALVLAGEALSVVGQWFIDNADDAHLESLITPEFKATILGFGDVAEQIEEALRV